MVNVMINIEKEKMIIILIEMINMMIIGNIAEVIVEIKIKIIIEKEIK